MNNQARILFALGAYDKATNTWKVEVKVENNYENGVLTENMINWVDAVMGCVVDMGDGRTLPEHDEESKDGATILLTENGAMMDFDLVFDGEGVDKDTKGSPAMQLAVASVEEFGRRMKASQESMTQ